MSKTRNGEVMLNNDSRYEDVYKRRNTYSLKRIFDVLCKPTSFLRVSEIQKYCLHAEQIAVRSISTETTITPILWTIITPIISKLTLQRIIVRFPVSQKRAERCWYPVWVHHNLMYVLILFCLAY